MSYSRYVGRVGGLAVALGIGAAIGTACAVASADDTGASSSRQHSQAGSSRQATGPRSAAVRPRVAAPRLAAGPRVAKARAAASPSAPGPTGTLEPVLLTVAQSGRERFRVTPAAAQAAASTPTGTWVDIINNHYDRIAQQGLGTYLGMNSPYGDDLVDPTGILDVAYNFSADKETVLTESFRFTAEPYTKPVWNWSIQNFDTVPSTNLDMYLVKIDPTSYAIVGVHKMTPGLFTVKYQGRDPYTEFVAIAVVKGTTIGEFDGVPDIVPIKPGDPGDPGNPGPGPGDGVPLTPPVLTTRDITAHSVELVPDKDGSDDTRVVGYNIYRDGVKVNDKVVSTIFTFTDEDLDADVTYTYTARSVDAGARRAWTAMP